MAAQTPEMSLRNSSEIAAVVRIDRLQSSGTRPEARNGGSRTPRSRLPVRAVQESCSPPPKSDPEPVPPAGKIPVFVLHPLPEAVPPQPRRTPPSRTSTTRLKPVFCRFCAASFLSFHDASLHVFYNSSWTLNSPKSLPDW